MERFRELRKLRWRRLLLEPLAENDVREAENQLRALEQALAPLACTLPLLIHGAGSAPYPLLERAARTTGLSRVGLEDTLLLQDGSTAESNLQLHRQGLALMTAAGSQAPAAG